MPASEMVDGLLILLGGALMIAPGFITDLVGLSLMLPPVRAVVRRVFRSRIEAHIVGGPGPGSGRGGGSDGPTSGGIIDLP